MISYDQYKRKFQKMLIKKSFIYTGVSIHASGALIPPFRVFAKIMEKSLKLSISTVF